MAPEYYTVGRFPESKRLVLIGPRKRSHTTLTTKQVFNDEENPSGGYVWKGELEVDGKEIKGKIVFERNDSDENFKTEEELLDFLAERYSISRLADTSKPAIMTGG